MEVSGCKDEIIDFVLHSSDLDNFILATFIAGMQSKGHKEVSPCTKDKMNDRCCCQGIK